MKKHNSIRIFENPILESLTHVHPITPLIVWSPVILYLTISSAQKYTLSWGEMGTWAFLGLLIWTFTEYILHRFIFHFPAKSKLTKRFVFLFHGLHHDDPQDPTRLVFPPIPAAMIVTLLYLFFGLFIIDKYHQFFFGFFLIGYLCYDYIHYATHHFKMTSRVGHFLRAYHLKHHYSHLPEKYGVSNPLWDYVFNTVHAPSSLRKKQV